MEVAITIDSNDWKEYDNEVEDHQDDQEEPNIEARSTQTFAIRMRVDGDFEFEGDTLRFLIDMDGSRVATHSVFKKPDQEGYYEIISQGSRNGDGRLRKYQFATLETSEF